jgi:uncharacterized membrane protein
MELNGVRGNGSRAPEMETLARALGWFSLGLGLAQVVAPRRVANLVGLAEESQAVMRVLGLREIASGIGILTQQRPEPWLWARVGGDAIDLALLGSAMSSPRANKQRVAAATAAVLGVTAADALASTRLTGEQDPAAATEQPPADTEIRAVVTVNAPADKVFAFWEGFQNLPRFMQDLATVTVADDRHSHWTMTGPAGISVEWDAEISASTPNESIAWRTVEGAPFASSGEVTFRAAPGDRGTEVHYAARIDPPGGELGRRLAGLFTDALGVKAGNDLRRAKQLIEIREIVRSDDSVVKGPNPAQPTVAA